MPIIAGLAAGAQAIQLISAILGGGMAVWGQFKLFLAQNNIQADTDKLEEIIVDAERRRAARELEARADQ